MTDTLDNRGGGFAPSDKPKQLRATKSLPERWVKTDTTQMQNKRGEWVPAIPYPFLGFLKKHCSCGASFWRQENYQAHYALKHILWGELPL